MCTSSYHDTCRHMSRTTVPAVTPHVSSKAARQILLLSAHVKMHIPAAGGLRSAAFCVLCTHATQYLASSHALLTISAYYN